MSVGESVGDFADNADRIGNRELLLTRQPVAKGFPFDKWHDVEDKAVCLAGVVQRKDVRMSESGGELDLSQESLRSECSCNLGIENFDGDAAVVSQVISEIY